MNLHNLRLPLSCLEHQQLLFLLACWLLSSIFGWREPEMALSPILSTTKPLWIYLKNSHLHWSPFIGLWWSLLGLVSTGVILLDVIYCRLVLYESRYRKTPQPSTVIWISYNELESSESCCFQMNMLRSIFLSPDLACFASSNCYRFCHHCARRCDQVLIPPDIKEIRVLKCILQLLCWRRAIWSLACAH